MVRAVLSLPFVMACVLLGAAAVLAGPVADWLGIQHEKERLPLKASLATLDESALAPYRVVERMVLEPEVVEALGTEEYIYWALEDTSVPPGDPLRYATLFVAYYTGGRMLAPHRPDLCYLGAGYEPAQRHENVDLAIPTLGDSGAAVPVRLCTFVKTALRDRERESVVYTFHANGAFAATSYGVRRQTAGLRNRYAYFSKVEIKFPRATREQCVTGARKLYSVVLPVLLADHWPDYEAAEAAARRSD